jgi:hypothetical protein
VDREGLWFRVLAVRYGVEGGRLRNGGQRGSAWWREIAQIREGGVDLGADGSGSMFRKKVGMSQILFSRLASGWMGLICVSGLGACLICRRPNCVRWLRCFR